MPGDIDIYFTEYNDYAEAKKWMRGQGYLAVIDNWNKQESYHVGKFVLDFHSQMLTFENTPFFEKRWLSLVQDELKKPNHEYLLIGGANIRVMHHELNLLYVFFHLFFHFIQGGVGLRQVCDWVIMSGALRDRIDRHKYTELVKRFELEYVMSLFARLAVEYLKAPEDIFISVAALDDKYVKMIYQEIMEGGNFGFNRKASHGGWRNVPRLYLLMMKKNFRLRKIAPRYTTRILRLRMRAHIHRINREIKQE